DEVRAGPVRPEVMSVRTTPPATRAPRSIDGAAPARPTSGRPVAGGVAVAPTRNAGAGQGPSQPTVVTPPPAPAIMGATATGLPRNVNLNYLIIQSYPGEEKK